MFGPSAENYGDKPSYGYVETMCIIRSGQTSEFTEAALQSLASRMQGKTIPVNRQGKQIGKMNDFHYCPHQQGLVGTLHCSHPLSSDATFRIDPATQMGEEVIEQ
jgi:hypothetical protein